MVAGLSRERMTIVDWNEHITVDPQVLAGKPLIKKTRIAVEFVLDLLARGWTIEHVLTEYDYLTRADIQACLANHKR